MNTFAADTEYNGTPEQKVMGLMTIWAEAKYAFPFFDQVPDLDWDAKVQEFIPRVIAADNIEDYYKVLMEFAALLNDGHTGVNQPGGLFRPGYDFPPIEVQVIEDRFFIVRAGETDETKRQRIYPGLEIVEIGDGVPVKTFFEEEILRYSRRGTKQADEAINVWNLLAGTKDSEVSLKVKDMDGTVRQVLLSRNSACDNGEQFQCRMIRWYTSDPALETRMLSDDILYVKIANFGKQNVVDEFQEMIDDLDDTVVKGMVIDIRHNPGGNSDIAAAVTGYLIDQPIKSGVWNIPYYSAADRSWENEIPSREFQDEIKPREGKKYLGPLVILTGSGTFSSAEGFLVPLRFYERALFVGEKTSGSTGNPLRVPLPGGGDFRVVTVKMTYPDGKEFVGFGIEPDIEAHTTPKDIYEKKDPVLEAGIATINNWRTENN